MEPEIRIVERKVPTAVSCVPDSLPAPKPYPDIDAALRDAPSAAERYQIMAAGRLLKDQRLREVEPVIAACRKPDG